MQDLWMGGGRGGFRIFERGGPSQARIQDFLKGG